MLEATRYTLLTLLTLFTLLTIFLLLTLLIKLSLFLLFKTIYTAQTVACMPIHYKGWLERFGNGLMSF